jgi:hypothetical protein
VPIDNHICGWVSLADAVFPADSVSVAVCDRSNQLHVGVANGVDNGTVFHWVMVPSVEGCTGLRGAPGSPLCTVSLASGRFQVVDLSQGVCYNDTVPASAPVYAGGAPGPTRPSNDDDGLDRCVVRWSPGASAWGAVDSAFGVNGTWIESWHSVEPEYRVLGPDQAVYAYRFALDRATDWVEDLYRPVPLGSRRVNAIAQAATGCDISWVWGQLRWGSTEASPYYALAATRGTTSDGTQTSTTTSTTTTVSTYVGPLVWDPPCRGYEDVQTSRTTVVGQTCAGADAETNYGPGYRLNGVLYGYGRVLADLTNETTVVAPLLATGAHSVDSSRAVGVLHSAIVGGHWPLPSTQYLFAPSLFDYVPVVTGPEWRVMAAGFVFVTGTPRIYPSIGCETVRVGYVIPLGTSMAFCTTAFGVVVTNTSRGVPDSSQIANLSALARVSIAGHVGDIDPARYGCRPRADVPNCYSPYLFADGDGTCSVTRTCDPDHEYETTAPTPLSDRECTPKTKCGVTAYESYPGTATTDRNCTTLRGCSASE